MTPRPDGSKGKPKQGGKPAPKPAAKSQGKSDKGKSKSKKNTPAKTGENAVTVASSAEMQRQEIMAMAAAAEAAIAAAAAEEAEGEPETTDTIPTESMGPETQSIDSEVADKAVEESVSETEVASPEPQPGEPEAQKSVQAPAEERRKVPKTMMYDTGKILAAAAAVEAEKSRPQTADPGNNEGNAAGVQPRKVAKTMMYDTSSLVAAAEAAEAAKASSSAAPAPEQTAQDAAAEATASAPAAEEPAAPAAPAAGTEEKRRVPKTMLYDTGSVLASAAAAEAAKNQAATETNQTAEASGTTGEGNTAPRKVAKTMMYDTGSIREAAAAAEAQSLGSAAQPSEEPAAPQAESEEKKRKVPKTMLYDTSNLVAAAEAAEAAAKAQEAQPEPAMPETKLEEMPLINMSPPATGTISSTSLDRVSSTNLDRVSSTNLDAVSSTPSFTDRPAARSGKYDAIDAPPPELNIDGPSVRLFFEEPLPAKEAAEAAAATQTTAQPVQDFSPAAADSIEPAAQTEPEKPKRKVPRTLLYNPVLTDLGLQVDSQSQAAQPGEEGGDTAGSVDQEQEVRRISTKQIRKSLQNNPTSSSLTAPQAEAGPQPAGHESLNAVEAEKVVERYIARTMLDHQILYAELSKSQQKMEEKVAEVVRERANEPFKPFIQIECNKKAMACGWTWDATYAPEKFRYCGQCQKPVYNLAGLEQPDADELVLKAENLKKYTLYKRTDGLYMTSDCPVAVKRRTDLILMSTFSVIIATAFVVYLTTLPKPKPKPAPTVTTTTTKKPSSTLSTKLKSKSGSMHYDGTTDTVTVEKAAPPVQQPVPSTSTGTGAEQEEVQNWDFSGPQSGNN